MNISSAFRLVSKWIDKKSNRLLKNEVLFQFIIIFTVYLFIAYPTEMVFATETPLGKLVAVIIIIYYASIDFTYGLFACGIVLYYYQLDLIESLVKIETNDKIANTIEILNKTLHSSVTPSSTQYQVEAYTGITDSVYKYEPMESFDYNENILLLKARGEFRKENCKNGDLMIKGMTVRPEFSDHIFREIQFKHGNKCNPCDESCGFSIIESKLKNEESVRQQVSGRTGSTHFLPSVDFSPVVSMFDNMYESLYSSYM